MYKTIYNKKSVLLTQWSLPVLPEDNCPFPIYPSRNILQVLYISN